MASLDINQGIQIDFQVILDSLAKLETPALESFAEQVNSLLAKRKTASISLEETQLLLAINKGLPKEILERLHALQLKQRNKGISPDETKELEEIIYIIEKQEAERLENLLALAQSWDMSLEDVREKLGINAPEPNVW